MNKNEVINLWKKYLYEIDKEEKYEMHMKSCFNMTINELFEQRKKDKSNDKLISDILKQRNESSYLEEIIKYNEAMFKNIPFWNFYKPILFYFFEGKSKFEEYQEQILDIDNFMCRMLIQGYLYLHNYGKRSIIFELNYARENNELYGDSAEDRYHFFNAEMLSDDMFLKSLYSEYSELFKVLTLKANQYVEYVIDILEAYKRECHQIKKVFCFENNEKIVDVKLGQGDLHKGGKTVAILQLENNLVVYKPNKLGLEIAYYELIKWINQKIDTNLVAAKSYFTGNAVWMEYMETSACKTEEDIKEFYLNIGLIMCILYSLNATDFHHENILACGRKPVLIDLETLITPFIEEENKDALSVVSAILERSIASMHLLPEHIINTNDQIFDVSGLGAINEQQSPYKVEVLANVGMDTMKVERNFVQIKAKNNNPVFENEKIESVKYLPEIKIGFEKMYYWIIENRSEYKEKVLAIFKGTSCRYIANATAIYANLLNSSFHPDVLRNSIDRKVLLSRIAFSQEEISPLVKSEINDMYNGDIPYFSVGFDDRNIFDSEEHMVQEYTFSLSPSENFIRKINEFSERDLEIQLSILDFTYLYTVDDVEFYKERTLPKGIYGDYQDCFDSSSEWIELSQKIGKHIFQQSIKGKNGEYIDRSWIGPVFLVKKEMYVNVKNIGLDMYKGNSGLALYFASIYKLTGLEYFKIATIETLNTSIGLSQNVGLDAMKEYAIGVGAFNGLSGIAYSAFWVGVLLGEKQYIDFAKDFLSELVMGKNTYPKDDLDVISGLAGLLSVLMSLINNAEGYIAKEDVNKLVECSDIVYSQMKQRLTEDEFFGCDGLTGYGHGTSGICTSLYKYYLVKKDDSVLKDVRILLEYERTMYSTELNNWYLDRHKDDVSYGWCHGSSGILLNRLFLYGNGYFDDYIENEIQIALKETLENGFGNNPTYCHGDPGNFEIIMYATHILKDTMLEEQVKRAFNHYVNNYIMQNWDKPLLGHAEVFALMSGMASIGYSLNKFLDKKLPNILLLE